MIKKDLLRYVLEYEPAERPSAVDILNHPWFREFVVQRHAGSVIQLVLFLLFCNPAIHHGSLPIFLAIVTYELYSTYKHQGMV